jgi:type I restriction enzyme M protein
LAFVNSEETLRLIVAFLWGSQYLRVEGVVRLWRNGRVHLQRASAEPRRRAIANNLPAADTLAGEDSSCPQGWPVRTTAAGISFFRMHSMSNFQETANFIWQVADDILRNSYKQHEYGDVILPFVVLRRLDCVLEAKKEKVFETYTKFKKTLRDKDIEKVLLKAAGLNFYNTSKFDLDRLSQDNKNLELNFNNYLNHFSDNVREILENFQIDKVIERLSKNKLLFLMVDKFTEIDLHPERVSNHEMGYIFEELIRRFNEQSNETAGEHFTPREVIRLMVNLVFAEHQEALKQKGIIRTLYDPACGTGGMLTIAKEHILSHINPNAEIVTHGQEVNPQSYAIAKSDALIMGENADNIQFGNSFTEDRFVGRRFYYMFSNPPFGVSWKKEQQFIENEAANPHGRFFAGTPRVSDGSLLFLQHMIAKMEPSGSRIAIVFNGSPLFTGDAGSGESNIRKWIIESDMLEAIVGLPDQLFFNTGISTYVWIVTNKKSARRKGKVQLINAVGFFEKMRKSLGNKRNYLTDRQIEEVTRIYAEFREVEHCKIFKNEDFGYTKVTVERPLRDEKGEIVKDNKGNPKPDSGLRDTESIPLTDDIEEYFRREVLPHVPDASMDRTKDKVGYEISFTKYFYKYQPLRPLKDITADILALEKETEGLLKAIIER